MTQILVYTDCRNVPWGRIFKRHYFRYLLLKSQLFTGPQVWDLLSLCGVLAGAARVAALSWGLGWVSNGQGDSVHTTGSWLWLLAGASPFSSVRSPFPARRLGSRGMKAGACDSTPRLWSPQTSPLPFSVGQSKSQGQAGFEWRGYGRDVAMRRAAEFAAMISSSPRGVKPSVGVWSCYHHPVGPDVGWDRAAAVEGSSGQIFASQVAMPIRRLGPRGSSK